MKNVIVLLKKDITLDKTYLVITTALAFGIPIFVANNLVSIGISKGIDFASLLLSTLYCYFMLFSKIGMIEDKYQENKYILLTPVSRKQIVGSKYLLMLFIYFLCIISYYISNFLSIGVPVLKSSTTTTVLVINALIMGIYIPLEFKIGYENIKYYLMVLVVGGPLVVGGLGKYQDGNFLLKIISLINDVRPYFLIISVIILILSYFVAVYIYEHKDI